MKNKAVISKKEYPYSMFHILHSNKGFTLVELMVSVGIFTFLTLIVLVNHSRFSGAILLENLAYDIALSIRQAQIFGLSVREFEPGSGEFQPGYGVHFDRTTPTQYIIFADRNLNFRYDDAIACGVTGSECIEEFTIQQGNSISRFCGTLPSSVVECSPALSFISAVFIRPDPDAIITSSNPGFYSDATITIRSPHGVLRDVIVRVTGQISIPQ